MGTPTFAGAVLFDLDGTLIDTAADFIKVLNAMRRDDNLDPLPDDRIRNTVSNGARALITLAYNLNEGDEGFEPKRNLLLDRYEEELGNAAQLFEGYEELITQLENHNIAWGIVTNKPERFTAPLLKRLNINPTNGVAICPDHVSKTKPSPEPLYLAAEKLALKPEQCIYVGDHKRDIDAGKNANMITIACSFGYVPEGECITQWNADYIANKPMDIYQQIQNHFEIN